MNANEYLNLIGNLNLVVMDDPTAMLALTVAWLDPLTVLEDVDDLIDTDITDFYHEGDDLGAALRVARDCFPGIYAEAIGKIREGAGYEKATNYISSEIAAQTSIPTDMYGEPVYAYGIPMPFYGPEWNEPTWIEDNPELTELVLMLGATREETRWSESIEFSQRTYQIAHLIQSSLMDHYDDPLHRSIMWAIGHATESTGNSSVDFSYEVGAEFQPLAWTVPDVEFASAIIQEAQEMMLEAHQGLIHISNDEHIKSTLIERIGEAGRIVDRINKRGKTPNDYISDDDKNPFSLRWDNLRPSSVRDTTTDFECVQLRMDAA
ncbi:MAG: hypothetical protein AAFQ57_11155 [Cyanobacteria bacterium J06626_14]